VTLSLQWRQITLGILILIPYFVCLWVHGNVFWGLNLSYSKGLVANLTVVGLGIWHLSAWF
jgi:hypothetical protein